MVPDYSQLSSDTRNYHLHFPGVDTGKEEGLVMKNTDQTRNLISPFLVHVMRKIISLFNK